VAGWLAGADSPNGDGFRWFCDEIWPRIRDLAGDATLYVTGVLPDALRPVAAQPGIVAVGHVPDVSSVYRRLRVAVVPLRVGAGVKVKTLEALQHGIPVVATAVGAEGLPAPWPAVIDVADTAEAFARTVATLLTDDQAWHTARRRISRLSGTNPDGAWLRVITGASCSGIPRAQAPWAE
jgi:glycosyltransferase involved in cell wall biosynthesis